MKTRLRHAEALPPRRLSQLSRVAPPRSSLVVVGYALNVGLLGIATLVAIPIMIASGGVSAWASAALGQSIGVLVAVLVGYGWAISGPAIIKKAFPEEYATVLSEASRTRFFLLIPILLIALAACFYLVPNGNNIFALLGLVSTGLLGLRLNWFMIGLQRPYVLLALETIPRIIGIMAGLFVMLQFNDMTHALLGQIAGVLTGIFLSGLWTTRYVRQYSKLRHPPVRGVWEALEIHRFGMSAATVSALYGSGPIMIVGFTAPWALGTYAVMDRIIKQLFTAASPLIDALRGWVPHRDEQILRGRAKAALLITATGAIIAGIALTVAGSVVVGWFTSGQIRPDLLTSALFGALFALALYSMILGQVVLVSMDLSKDLFFNGLVGSGLGLILVAPTSYLLGIYGVFASLIIGHLFVITRNHMALSRRSSA